MDKMPETHCIDKLASYILSMSASIGHKLTIFQLCVQRHTNCLNGAEVESSTAENCTICHAFWVLGRDLETPHKLLQMPGVLVWGEEMTSCKGVTAAGQTC